VRFGCGLVCRCVLDACQQFRLLAGTFGKLVCTSVSKAERSRVGGFLSALETRSSTKPSLPESIVD
jgi:hypothetical protein